MLTRVFDTHMSMVEDGQHLGSSWLVDTTVPNDEWVIIDLGAEFDLYRIEVWNFAWSSTLYDDAGVKDMDILASNDPTFATSETLVSITDLPEGPMVNDTIAYGEEYPVTPVSGPYRYIKLDIASNWGHADLVGLQQIEFYGTGNDCAGIISHYGYEQMAMDLNNNCVVDLADFAIFASAWLDEHPDMP